MDEIIDNILEIVDDYGVDNLFFQKLSKESVYQWIEQFNEDDREFLLEELLHLLPKSYLSKNMVREKLNLVFEKLREDFNYDNVQDFLDETYFLDCQEDEKSQKVLLEFVDEIIQEKYEYSISDCGTKKIRYWLYLDDIFASGGTFRNDIIQEVENYGIEDFVNSSIEIVGIFFIVHKWGKENTSYALSKKFGNKFKNKIKLYKSIFVDNYPHVNSYNTNPKFNHIYPIECDQGIEFLDYLENSFDRDYPLKHEKVAFRQSSYPLKEKFFSSKENRIRYENILLNKGIEIINSIDSLTATSLRPLGMTPPHFKTLGTGTHHFTWRNISNTCPLVFWWGTNGWHPLFPVQNRGRH